MKLFFSFLFLILAGCATLRAEVKAIVGKAQFTKEVIESKKPVIVDVGAPWCPACKNAVQPFHKLANEFPDIIFVSVNSDNNMDVVKQYNINSLPTFLFFNNGTLVTTQVGFSPNKIKETLRSLSSDSSLAPSTEKKNKLEPEDELQISQDEEDLAIQDTQEEIQEEQKNKLADTQSSVTQPARPNIVDVQKASCPTEGQSFLERTYTNISDFFSSAWDRVRSWFR